jgi:hypothetical protein
VVVLLFAVGAVGEGIFFKKIGPFVPKSAKSATANSIYSRRGATFQES